MKTAALIIGWFILIMLGLVFSLTLTIIAYAGISELVDMIKNMFKK